MVMPSIQDDGRSRVVGTARDRAPPYDGGSMVRFFLMIRKLHETEIERGN
jgi:hypothetical protein